MAELLSEEWSLVVTDSLFNVHGFAIAMHLWERRGIPYVLYCPTNPLAADVAARNFGWYCYHHLKYSGI